MAKVRIGKRFVGDGEPTFIIAEAGSNHDGRLRQAKRLIEIAAEAEADAVKFQLFEAERIAARTEDRIVQLEEGRTLYELYKSVELPREWVDDLHDCAREHEIEFLATPFDIEAVDLLEKLGVSAYKISSFEIVDLSFIRYIAKNHKPILLSTGMASLGEIEDALRTIHAEDCSDVILLHCGINYPLDYFNVNLLVIKTLRQAFRCPVGYSDHTLGISVPIAAVALGATVIEKHFTLDRSLSGPDHKFAATPAELAEIVKRIREVEQAKGSPVKGLAESETVHYLRGRRSIFANVDIPKGTRITENMLSILRPGIGLSPKFMDMVIGRVARVDIAKNEPITWDKI